MRIGTRAALVGAAISALLLTGLAAPARAGGPPPATGNVVCGTDGTYTITWTLENFLTGYTFDITSATVSGAVEGPVAFDPDSLYDGDTSVGTTTASGDTTGEVVLDVEYLVIPDGESKPFTDSVTTSVVLKGDCVAATTTTTAASTTTTTEPTVAAAVAAPRFTG